MLLSLAEYSPPPPPTPSTPKAIKNHPSLNQNCSLILAAEIDFLEQNGVSDPKLQFVYGTCVVTGCMHAEGLGNSL